MKKDIDWSKLGFGYTPTDFRFQAEWKDGKWSEGKLISDPNIELSEAACVFHYAQCCFEGLKAYETVDGHIVTFRPDQNAERMQHSAARLEMPEFPKELFVKAVEAVSYTHLRAHETRENLTARRRAERGTLRQASTMR